MQIYGFTNIFLLAVPYLAIDPLFPHHLNSFDNVPLNYSSGPLVIVFNYLGEFFCLIQCSCFSYINNKLYTAIGCQYI